MPRSKARCTSSRVASRSTLEPSVSHEPSEISLTRRPLRPRRRCSIAEHSTGAAPARRPRTRAGAAGLRGLRLRAMLSLVAPTEPAWTARALGSLDEVLVDHAHCEKKAAGMALRLLFSYPHRDFLQEPLARLAREELAHFEEVLGALRARGLRLRPQRPA